IVRCTYWKSCILLLSERTFAATEMCNAHYSDYLDSGVRFWRLSSGTWTRLLRRWRHQSDPADCSHPAFAQGHLRLRPIPQPLVEEWASKSIFYYSPAMIPELPE